MNVVDKLIFNCLVQYGNVALPEVGTLEVVAEKAKRNKTVGAGRKTLALTGNSKESHILITDIIADQGGLPAEDAAARYQEWLASARTAEGALTIGGVANISAKGEVEILSDMDTALNGTELPVVELKEKKHKCCWCWILLAVVVLGGAAWWFCCQKGCCTKSCEAPVVEEAVVVEPEEVVEPEVVKPTEEVAPKAKEVKRYNVTVGVFAKKGNAQWCATKDPLGIGKENYIIAPFPSGMEACIAYTTDNWNEALKYWRKYKKIQKDVWVYHRY